jgi:hypothetical protein
MTLRADARRNRGTDAAARDRILAVILNGPRPPDGLRPPDGVRPPDGPASAPVTGPSDGGQGVRP